MNKQPTTIRAYLLRGAFLLSLAFVIVMPLALGQTRSRGSKPSVAAAQMPQVAQSSTGSTDGSQLPTAISTAGDAQAVRIPALPGSQLPTSGSTGVRSLRILPQPTLPSVVLYDQYDNDLNNGIVSANRTDNSSLSAEAADNFVVPGGQTWTITEVDIRSPVGFPTPTSFAVNFYTDNGSGLPGTQVYTASGLAVTGNPDYVITLTTPAVLSSGTYWVSAVGTITGTNWYWEGRSVTSNGFATAWRNPGGGYGLGCTDWARLQDCIGFSWPDQMFRIVGTTGGGTPTPTPTATPTPTPTATPCGSTIYNIAGFGLGIQTTTTRIYDIATNTWTTGAPIPEPNGLSDHATAYFNGKIYVAGGFNGSGAINTVRAYDIATDTWSTLASLPQALFLPGFGIINGKLYIASGNSGVVELNTLYIYDIATNTWTTGPNVPTAVTGPGSAVYQGKLYLFGGGFPTTLTITQIFDPVANSWSSGPNMNVNRLWFYGGNIDDTSIVAPGGDQTPGIPINDNEQLTGTWAIKAPVPYNARGPFAVSDGTFVYIGGGYDGSTVHTDTLRYDPVANSYTPLAPAPDAHYLSQAVIVNIPCGTPTPTPTATPTPPQIVLTASERRAGGRERVQVRLSWTGANSPRVDIYRNGVQIARVDNTGTYTDLLTAHGLYTYKVCEAHSHNCSNEVTVRGP